MGSKSLGSATKVWPRESSAARRGVEGLVEAEWRGWKGRRTDFTTIRSKKRGKRRKVFAQKERPARTGEMPRRKRGDKKTRGSDPKCKVGVHHQRGPKEETGPLKKDFPDNKRAADGIADHNRGAFRTTRNQASFHHCSCRGE